MIVTVEDARQTRCCGPDNCGAARAVAGTSEAHYRYCIGSFCMAWRKLDQVGIGPNGERRDRDMDGRTRWVDRGYCGLAGTPPTCRSLSETGKSNVEARR